MKSCSLIVLACLLTAPVEGRTRTGHQNQVLQLRLQSSRTYDYPSVEVDVAVCVTDDRGTEWLVPAFWAGEREWRFRFSSPQPGTYTYLTRCSDPTNEGLHQQRGALKIEPYTGTNPLYIHGPLQNHTDSLTLQHADGTPFLWLADSWWHGMTTRFAWPEDFQALTRDRKDKGFSVIQFAIGYPCDIYPFDSRGANEAGFPTSRDYREINPAYFDLVDKRVEYLVDQGLVPNILGTWGYYLPWFGVENMQRYWRYLIARYGAYPVTWTLAGETTLIYYLTESDKREEVRQFQRDGWTEVAQYIKTTDPYHHLLSAHPGPASGRFEPISDPSLLDIIMAQPGHSGWDTLPGAVKHLQIAQSKFPDRPVMQGEVCFEGMHGGGSDAKLQRLLFWTNMLSGAAGHCYGVDAIWQFNTEQQRFGMSPGGHIWGNTPWEEAYQWQGSLYVGLGRKILERFEWHRFETHPEWVDPAADHDNAQDAYATGVDKGTRMFYFPRGVMPWGQMYLLLELDPDVVYQATFIDPRTGEEHPVRGAVSGVTSWQVPAAPILQDWLLVLRPLAEKPPSHPEPVDADASAEARQLLDYLYAIKGKNTLSGQHNYPGTISAYTDEVFDLTGRFPVIWGQDFGFTAEGKDGIIHRDAIIQEALARHIEGYIITLMWHAVRPIDDEPSGWKSSVQNDLTEAQWRELVTPGTALHRRWLRQLDGVAEHLKVLRDHRIPVLWRPYHEMNGGWFWWGDKRGAQGYQALWRHMVDRFVHHHQLNNLLWVWNANALVNRHIGDYHHYFPGLDVVDILATDVYGNDCNEQSYTSLLELAQGKPIALGECGQLPTPEILTEQPEWTWFMCWAGFFTRKNDLEAVRALYDAPRVLTRCEVQWK